MSDLSELDDLGEPDEERLVETGDLPDTTPGPTDELPVEVAEEPPILVPDDERLVDPVGEDPV
ncbi:MAG: hypothetical protein JWM47_16 [Acidimicrobiales bacterium]|nr:hypothetical protein [Acidimicrobiales bacterium]